MASLPPEERVDSAQPWETSPAVPAGTHSAARGKTAVLAILFAGGLGYGASRCGVVALGAHDDHPTEMSALTAAAEPINRWVTVRGRMAPGSLFKSGDLMA